jgi:hypothetical protein
LNTGIGGDGRAAVVRATRDGGRSVTSVVTTRPPVERDITRELIYVQTNRAAPTELLERGMRWTQPVETT